MMVKFCSGVDGIPYYCKCPVGFVILQVLMDFLGKCLSPAGQDGGDISVSGYEKRETRQNTTRPCIGADFFLARETVVSPSTFPCQGRIVVVAETVSRPRWSICTLQGIGQQMTPSITLAKRSQIALTQLRQEARLQDNAGNGGCHEKFFGFLRGGWKTVHIKRPRDALKA